MLSASPDLIPQGKDLGKQDFIRPSDSVRSSARSKVVLHLVQPLALIRAMEWNDLNRPRLRTNLLLRTSNIISDYLVFSESGMVSC